MARKKIKTVTVEEEQPEILQADPFERARAEFSASDVGELKLRVDRYEEGEQREKYLRQVNYNPEVHNNDWIRKTWGPGSYLLRFYDSTRRGWSKVVDLAADAPLATPPAPTGTAHDELFAMLREQNAVMMQALLAGRTAPAAGGMAEGVLLKLLEGNNELNKTLLSSMLNRGDTTATLLSTVEGITKVASELSSEQDGSWLGTIRAIAKEFMPVISQMVQARPRVAPGAPALAAGAPPPPAGPGDMMHFLDEVLRQYAPALLNAAQQGASAEDVADDILGEVPPKYYPMFDSLAADRILALEPRLSPYQTFVAEIVRLLKQRDFEGEAG